MRGIRLIPRVSIVLLIVGGLGLRAYATLAGDEVAACVVNYPGCVGNPTPGINEGGTLNANTSVIGTGVEFSWNSGSGDTTFLADFGDISLPDSDSLLLTIRNDAFITASTDRTDLGWVFTGIDSPIDRVILLGGSLEVSELFWESGSIGVNFAPFSIPSTSPNFKTVLLQIVPPLPVTPTRIGACVGKFGECLFDPSPGVNDGGLLDTGLALPSDEVEFAWTSQSGHSRFLADFALDPSGQSGSLRITIQNLNGLFSVGTSRTDLGWAFSALGNVSFVGRLGGDLGASAAAVSDPGVIVVSIPPFSIPHTGVASKSDLFLIIFGESIPEQICNDGVDDDGDGRADLRDDDCRTFISPIPGTTPHDAHLIAIFDHDVTGAPEAQSVVSGGLVSGTPGTGFGKLVDVNSSVLAFNGQSAENANGNHIDPNGVCYGNDPIQANSGPFLPELNYTQAGRTILCYDGHWGLDFENEEPGDDPFPVVSAAAGTIIFKGCACGFLNDNNVCLTQCDLSLGNYIAIEHPNGLISYYGHLSLFEPSFNVGDSIEAGVQIGFSGKTGNAGGNVHLHFEVGYDDEQVVDPFGLDGRGVLWLPEPTRYAGALLGLLVLAIVRRVRREGGAAP